MTIKTPQQAFSEDVHAAAPTGPQAAPAPAAAPATAASRSPASLVTETTLSPQVQFRALPFTDVRWTTGFWADRLQSCRDTTIPAMRAIMEGAELTHFLQNFKIAAGLVSGRHRGPRWNDGDFYKWIEAASAIIGLSRDADLDAFLDEAISIIARAQRPDGYLHTPQLIAARSGGAVEPFADPMDFEMYNMGHLITAGVVHHRATGKDSLLQVALRAADFLDRTFAHPTPAMARHGICPSHLMALVELYRETRHQAYLDLAVRLLNMRDLVSNGDDDNQDRIPFRQQRQAVGHAVRATYLYAGAADIFTETGDASLLPPLKAIWEDLVQRKLYITGGCGALFDGASPDGATDQQTIGRVHQSFGRDYQLPNSTAHNETCAAVGSVLWNWRMLQLTGEARYADLLEHTLFNAVLSGISLSGTDYFYTNTLRQLQPMPVSDLRWNRTRKPFISCFCCPPNVVRTIAELSGYAYLRSEQGLHVVLYGSSFASTTLPDGTPVRLRQQTDYPWDGRVRFTVDADAEFALSLRIPAWATKATLRINGQPAEAPPQPGTFHSIGRRWRTGDTVLLDLQMPTRVVEANPFVEEARNHVAVVRGPLVYCLESPDLPAETPLMSVRLPRNPSFTPWPATALPRLLALKTSAVATDAGDWSGQLYRDLSPAAARQVDVALVPYFAWDNRGQSEMTVWIPLV